MRRRPWILTLALGVLALGFIFLVLFRYVNRSQVLRSRLLAELTHVPGSITIERVDLLPASIRLSGFHYTSEDSSLRVSIRQARFRFSLTNLVLSGGPERLISDITLLEPVVRLTPGRKARGARSPVPRAPDFDAGRFRNLHQVALRDGRFSLVDRKGRVWLALGSLSGWLNSPATGESEFRMDGAFFEDSLATLRVQGTANLKRRSVKSEIALEDTKLSGFLLPDPAPVSGIGGLLNLALALEYDSSGFRAKGEWSLREGAVQIRKGPRLEAIDLRGGISEKAVTFAGVTLLEGDSTDVTARLTLDGPPVFRAKAHISRGRLGEHLVRFTRLKRKLAPRGTIEVNARFDWRPAAGRWRAEATASAESLLTPVGPFRDVRVGMSWSRDRSFLSFDEVDARWYGLAVDGSGWFKPGAKRGFSLNLHAGGDASAEDLPLWAAGVETKSADFDLSITHRKKWGWQVEAQGRARAEGDPSLAELTGYYAGKGYRLGLNLYSPRKRDASFELSSTVGHPTHFSVKEPHILAAWWNPDWAFGERLERIETSVEVDLADGSAAGAASLHDPETDFNLDISGSLLLAKAGEKFEGTYSYSLWRADEMIGNGDVDFLYREKQLEVNRFTFKDYLQLAGAFDFAGGRFEKVELVVEDLDLDDIVHRITSLPQGSVGGKINGRIDLSGPFRRPEITSHFELFDGWYGDQQAYWGLLTLETDIQHNLVIKEGSFGRSESILLRLTGEYGIPEDKLDIAIISPGTDAGILAGALTGKPNLLLGEMALSGRVTGKLLLPRWSANLRLIQAKVAGIAFDDVAVDLEGITSKRLGLVVYIRRFDMNRVGRYTLHAEGAAPLKRGAGEITTRMSGALFDLFPQINPFFRDPTGSGEVNWTFTIVAGKLAATRGSIRLNNGSLTFADVLPGLDHVMVDAEVDADGNAMIHRFDGVIGRDAPVEIRNERGDASDPGRLPILIRGIGLDLGVLKLRTKSAGGLPFRIPGVMPPNEYARLTMHGRDGGDWFLISGPPDSLLLSGRMSLSRARISYPPVATEKKKPSPFVRLLRNARWNSSLVVAQDVRFQKSIRGLENAPFFETFSGLFDQIDVDIEIEPQDPDRPLELRGRLSDNSFRLVGELVSTRGTIDFLDLQFQMQHADLVFDQTSILPVASGRAEAGVLDPETGFTRKIDLTLYVIDPTTGQRSTKGRWGEFTFVLEDPQDPTLGQEELLAALGYQQGKLNERFTSIGAEAVNRAVTRRLLRPIERDVARLLGLDIVRINPTFAQNVLRSRVSEDPTEQQQVEGTSLAARYFMASSVTVGKYINRDLFFSYTGRLGGDPRYTTLTGAEPGRVGLLQTWNLEYRISAISPNFLVEGEWQYDNVEDINNRSIRLKYAFVF